MTRHSLHQGILSNEKFGREKRELNTGEAP